MREARYIKIGESEQEGSICVRNIFINTDDPSQRYRIVQGNLYDDRTGELVATKICITKTGTGICIIEEAGGRNRFYGP